MLDEAQNIKNPKAEQTRLHAMIGRRLLDELLTERGLEALDDSIFTIADHLDLGTTTIEELRPDQRLELSRINHLAGERALATTAWEPALRYLGLARGLVEPWLAEARQGRGDQRHLCLAISDAHAQALAMCEGPAADTAFAELLGEWQLSTADYGEIVTRYLLALRFQDRQADTVDQALRALARLGLHLPKHPRRLRAAINVLSVR